jgi:hypothetical protein
MDRIVRGYDVDEYNKYIDAVKYLKDTKEFFTKSIQDLKGQSPSNFAFLDLYMVIYDRINKLKQDTLYILYILNKESYNQGIYYDKSESLSFGINLEKKDFNTLATEYFKRANESNIELASLIAKNMNLSGSAHDFAKFLRDKYYKNDLSYYLINKAMEYTDMSDFVNEMKDDALEPPPVLINDTEILLMLNRHGLFPVTDSMPLNKLFKLVGIDYNTNKPIEQINTHSKGVIAISKCFSSPIEYNILPLISQTYIHDKKLNTSEQSGITPRIIRRFQTIINKPPKDACVKREVQTHIMKNNIYYNTCYIVETLNNIDFRFLSNNFNTYDVPYTLAKQILHISMRPYKYNQIMENYIVNAISPHYETILKDFNADKSDIFVPDIFNDKIKKDFLNALNLFLRGSNPSETLLLCWLTCLHEFVKVITIRFHDELRLDRKNLEFMGTYLKNIDDITQKFYSAFQSELHKINFPKEIFTKYSEDERYKYILDTVGQLFDNTIKYTDYSIWTELGASLKLYALSKYKNIIIQ